MDIKPGKSTTEWKATIITVVTSILVILVSFGVISQVESDHLVEIVGGLVTAAIALLSAVKVVIEYIKSRADVKVAARYTNNNIPG